MCTVTFIPYKNGNGYILTSSRDEKTSRPNALAPQKYNVFQQQVFFPKDKLAGGTWVATSINNFTLCLLNGAFNYHDSKPPYRLSRGLMLLDFFKYNNVDDFAKNYDFSNIENFTLIVVNANNKLELTELRWDGTHLYQLELDTHSKHIWSSCTLYKPDAVLNRKTWFANFCENTPQITKDDIMLFHQNAGDGSLENSILMNRENRVKTVSITCIDHSIDSYTMQYLDIETMQNNMLRIFKSESN